ncbi:hypothetical protein [Effusibacillus lacus]|uniref:Uncharacterized protein n=1 Tax=Effusibacillus lacus TaxID=1348429 RepID=A0A292YLH2_9BACL|nr:hypothetical protein [Effusibacillus lacus]TCS74215.1 hypothetical protein EDD64_11569 [Effusibacillus lacus]GAX90788.1 hypothetical protein EFBL_2430 [Effusibacillus lacus]
MNPLDWTHIWDDYEMMMYVGKDDTGQEKIFMQVSRIIRTDQATEQEILYDREIGFLNPDIIRGVDRDAWEEKQLRWFLETHPDLVEREKTFLKEWEKSR